jgi:hypothetical protein
MRNFKTDDKMLQVSKMDSEIQSLMTKAFPNQKTRENYISRINGLLKHMDPVDLMTILHAPDTYYPKLQEVYPSLTTRKNILTVILVLFREHPELSKEQDLKDTWKQLHDTLAKHQDARIKRSEPADKQIAQYTSYEEIEAMYEKLKKTKPHTTLRKSQQYLLMSVLVHLRPKRADLGSVKVYYDKDPAKSDENYLLIRRNSDQGASFLAMNIYKTSKHYATVEEDLADALVQDIVKSMDRWPRDYLFVKENREAMSNNTYTHFVKNTFQELFGRSTGVSMLRHIYISEKLDFDDMTLEEQEQEARYMLHTSGLQRRYKWPKKILCPKLCAAYMPPTKRTRKVIPSPTKGKTRHTRKMVKSPLTSESPV